MYVHPLCVYNAADIRAAFLEHIFVHIVDFLHAPEKYGAYRAVDGIKDASGIEFHTCNMAQPWWRVDLGAAKEIEHVTIYNRIVCCQNRLSNFYVRFLDDSGAQVKEVYHSGSAGYIKTIDAGDNVSAR